MSSNAPRSREPAREANARAVGARDPDAGEGGRDSGLVVRVPAEEVDFDLPLMRAAFGDVIEALAAHDGTFVEGSAPVSVGAHGARSLARALCVLANPAFRRKPLVCALSTMGRRVIDPLVDVLESSIGGGAAHRLSRLRDVLLAQVGNTALTPETKQMVHDDLRTLLTDDYLAMLADNEERVQRPRAEVLAQRALRVVGARVDAALREWPAHAPGVADAAVREMNDRSVTFSQSPVFLRRHVVGALGDYLFATTAAPLDADLKALFEAHPALVDEPPAPLDRTTYNPLADACWDVIVDHS